MLRKHSIGIMGLNSILCQSNVSADSLVERNYDEEINLQEGVCEYFIENIL